MKAKTQLALYGCHGRVLVYFAAGHKEQATRIWELMVRPLTGTQPAESDSFRWLYIVDGLGKSDTRAAADATAERRKE